MEKNEERIDYFTDDKIIEFMLGDKCFGIPVLNVREIIRPSNITPVPRSHPFIEGITEIRGEVLPVINLAKALSIDHHHPGREERFIIGEFCEQRVTFHVDGVRQIVTSKNQEQPDDLYGGKEAFVKSVIKTEKQMIIILDYEKILEEIRT
ncbi:chemotaxis protein CheW [Fervidibacillus halotolerans]|uniref:Chemotaxis protein CheW n=1 Tax=Fervidibacillus halotolerans TaxID=2980027 RepID=A0A9E8M1H0_9BACI|nr:chemotaxis protein CheW [Fervidibacillus halotolerans]WAA13222.1 chemotaxis protein CheW [Fervidibacillus halotolerans]